MSDSLYAVYGASGFGREVLPIARKLLQAAGVPVSRLVFIDDGDLADRQNGHRVMDWDGFMAEPADDRYVALAIADGPIREKLAHRLAENGVKSWSLAADNVVQMDDVLVAEGAVLCPFVTLTSNIRIGRHFHANIYSYVAHDCEIGDFVTFAPGVKCNGNIVIESHAYIGTGAILRQGKPGQPLRIGRGAVVGMGAVVTKDVPPGVTVIGNPARIMDRRT